MTSGTSQRFGQSYPALGQDTFGRANSTVYLDKAFIQFAGFTAGRAGSFFDFYAHDLEHYAATSGSDVSSTQPPRLHRDVRWRLLGHDLDRRSDLPSSAVFADSVGGHGSARLAHRDFRRPDARSITAPFTQSVLCGTATTVRASRTTTSVQRELAPRLRRRDSLRRPLGCGAGLGCHARAAWW